MKFPYDRYLVRGIGTARYATVYRPTVMVRVTGLKGWDDVLGLVDTGADDTLFPDALIGPLGVVTRQVDQAVIVGIDGGTVLVRYASVELMLPGPGGDYRWSARVGFHPNLNAVLGHTGFLKHFTATFNGQRRHLRLTPNGTASPPS